MKQDQFSIADLPGSYLGLTQGKHIRIDANAAGYGWFVDPTPAKNEEFAATAHADQFQAVDPRAVDRIDLLTVVEHELGHSVGLADLDPSSSSVMDGQLSTGIRRTVGSEEVDQVLARTAAPDWL
jgi:large repetitive protein